VAPLAVALAGVPAAVAAAPVVRELRVAEVRGGRAVIVRATDAIAPVVVPIGAAGGVGRLQMDLPPGTRLAPGVPRVVQGAPPLLRARIGELAKGRSRLVLDVSPGARFLVRSTADRHGVSIVVAALPAVAQPTEHPAPAGAREATGSRPPGAPRRLRVVLDAGHGGEDPGAVGYVIEKHVTLDVVRRLALRLRENLSAEVILTRGGDATVPLAERTAIANRANADVFLSIHANAGPRGRSRGIETYVLDDADDQATLRLAAIENGTSHERYRAAPTDLRYILSSLVQGGKMPEASRLAETVQTELVQHMRARYPGVEDLGVKRGPFYVLVGTHMPCVLIEVSFVTNAVEGRRLADAAYRAALADGLARGISRFLAGRARARTL
jgi:N-acetylmuramoyl-L-alanine amidase